MSDLEELREEVRRLVEARDQLSLDLDEARAILDEKEAAYLEAVDRVKDARNRVLEAFQFEGKTF